MCTRVIRATGGPTPDPEAFMAFLPRLKEGSGAVINVTTGGGLNMTVDDRLKAPALLRPEMCSLNMGSMNFGALPARRSVPVLEIRLGRAVPPRDRGLRLQEHVSRHREDTSVLGKEHGCRFEHECYDVGHLYNLAHIVDRKLITPPFFIQMIFGVLGGIGPDIANLMFMKQTADRLFGSDYLWSVLAAGRFQMPFAAQSVLLGGSVRVGLEDSLFIGPSKAGELERRAGRESAHDRRESGTRNRNAGRSAPVARAEGARRGRVLRRPACRECWAVGGGPSGPHWAGSEDPALHLMSNERELRSAEVRASLKVVRVPVDGSAQPFVQSNTRFPPEAPRRLLGRQVHVANF